MFLTKALSFYKHFKKVPGSLRTGKHRAIPHISVSLKRQALKWLLLERDNLQVLSKPYLTAEESKRHVKSLYEPEGKWKEILEQKRIEKASKMLPNRYTIDLLEHLNHTKKWE